MTIIQNFILIAVSSLLLAFCYLWEMSEPQPVQNSDFHGCIEEVFETPTEYHVVYDGYMLVIPKSQIRKDVSI